MSPFVETQPLLTNFAVLSEQLREPGGLGVWVLGTNGAQQTAIRRGRRGYQSAAAVR